MAKDKISQLLEKLFFIALTSIVGVFTMIATDLIKEIKESKLDNIRQDNELLHIHQKISDNERGIGDQEIVIRDHEGRIRYLEVRERKNADRDNS